MSNSNDQSINNLIDDDVTIDCFSPATEDFLTKCMSAVTTNQDFTSVIDGAFLSSNGSTQSPSGFPPANNSTYQELSSGVSQAVALPANMQMNPTRLEIIAEPFYGGKLRYRSDYENNENRLGVMKNRTKNSSYQGPAIRIPPCYLNPNDGYSIRVSLVTIKYGKTGLHYLHPYELEHPTSAELNDQWNNSVWFPIEKEDCSTGIKSFPALRIVKKRAADMKTYGDLRVFDCQNVNSHGNSLRQLSTAKETINEYNIDHSQLVFTVGRRMINQNNQVVTELCPDSVVFSEEMIEGDKKESDADSDVQSPNETPVASAPLCRVYKYAPKYGFDTSQEDMVIFLTTKPETKKYGELKVKFQCDMPDNQWSVDITDLDVKDRMVSFKTPIFHGSVNETTAVDVIIQQNNRFIGTIKYYYLATLSNCSNCQYNQVQERMGVIPNAPVKRRADMVPQMLTTTDYNDYDCPQAEGWFLEVKHSSPELAQKSASTTEDPNEAMMQALTKSVESLFLKNDYDAFFRICRLTLTESPDLIHHAIEENHSDVLLKFIPTALIRLLQQENERGETALLHALRLNRLEIIQALLTKEKFKELLESVDKQNNNIFHIIALNAIPSETIDLLIDHLLKNSINIPEQFDHVNRDHMTPLQLSIVQKNLLATKYFLKHFQTTVHETKTGDNLLHLAVRQGDLPMVQYLIETGGLIEQVKQSNMQMTPRELAQSLQYHDIVKYFNEICPVQEIDESDSSDNDDD